MSPEFRENLIQALAARDEDRHEDVLKYADNLIKADPDSYIGYEMKANAFIFLNREEEAIIYLNQAIAVQPNTYSAYLKRGTIYRGFEKYAEALADFHFLIEHKQELKDAYAGRGMIFFYQCQWEMGIKDMEKALTLGWTNPMSNYYIGVAWLFIKNYSKALYYLDKAAADFPDDSDVMFARGRANFSLRHWKQCEQDMSKTIYLNENETEAYFYRACSRFEQHNKEGAERDLDKLFELNPAFIKKLEGKNLTPGTDYESLLNPN